MPDIAEFGAAGEHEVGDLLSVEAKASDEEATTALLGSDGGEVGDGGVFGEATENIDSQTCVDASAAADRREVETFAIPVIEHVARDGKTEE